MNGDRKKKQISVPLRSLLKKNIEIVNAIVNEIIPDEKKVKAGGKGFYYDFLVVALGADLAPEKIPGWDDSIHTFYTSEGAVRLNETLKNFSGGKVVLVISSMPYKCPGAPHEGAMLIEDFFTAKGLRKKVEISLFTPESQPLPGRWFPDKPMMLPKAGVFAHLQADVVAKNITNKINGKKADEKFCADGYCMLEAGEDLAGFAYGDFFGEPHPQVNLRKIGRKWHIGKVLFEKWWLSPVGFKKIIYKNLLQAGGKLMGIPVKL